jgi:WD40 repeat protein
MDHAVPSTLQWPREPYPGLRPFRVASTSDETLIFYGRNGHKDEIVSRLDRQQLVFVMGPSGCGKSSLVRAGVLPALQAGLLTKAGSEWRIVTMRPGLAPLAGLATAFSSLSPKSHQRIHSLLSRDVSGFWMVADILNEENVGTHAPILLLIDQFEEVFGLHVPKDEVDQFVRLVVRFFERPHPDIYVILTMRTDFLEDCTKFAGLASAINATQFLTPILGLRDLIQAISRPAEDYGGVVEKPLLDRLLLDMRPGAGYDPDNLALLQHALQWLWRRACARNGLTLSPKPTSDSGVPLKLDLQSYVEAGGMRGILNVNADEVASRYSGSDRAVLEAVFTRLAEKAPGGGYRRSPAKVPDIAAVSDKPGQAMRIVNELSHEDVEFLEIRAASQESEALVDICHEALIRTWDQYRAWVDREAEKLDFVRRIADDAVHWQRSRRREEDLQHGSVLQFRVKRWTELAPTKEWAERYPLAPDRAEPLSNVIPLIGDYFEESNRLDRREQAKFERLRVKAATARIRLARDRLIGVVTLLAIFAAFFGYRVYSGNQQANTLVAGSFRVLAEDAQARSDAPTALLWTLEGLKRAPGFENIFVPLLYRSLQELHLKKIVRSVASFSSVSFSPDSKLIVSAHQDGYFRISSVEAGVIAKMPIPNQTATGGGFARVRWSPDGELIAIAGRNAVTLLWACSIDSLLTALSRCKDTDRTKIGQTITLPFEGLLTTALFSPDSRMLLVQAGQTFNQGNTMLYDIAPLKEMGTAAPFKTIEKTTWAAAFSSDADDLAVGGQDSNIHIYRGDRFTEHSQFTRDERAPSQIWSLAFGGRPAEQVLYSGHSDGFVMKWEINTGKSITFQKQEGQVFQLSVSRGGDWVAGSSDIGFVTLWHAREQRPPIKLGPHGGPVWNFDMASSANWVIAPSGKSMYLWNRRALLAPESELSVAFDPSLSVTSDPDTYSIATASEDYKLRRPADANTASLAARTPAGDYFAVAEDATEDSANILLYSSREEYPIATLLSRPRKWKSVAFNGHNVVAYEAGNKISWQFFPTTAALVNYANDNIPRVVNPTADESTVDNRPMKLNGQSLCFLANINKPNSPECRPKSSDPDTLPANRTEPTLKASQP